MNLQQWAQGFQCVLGHTGTEYVLCVSPSCPQVRKLICRQQCIPYYHKNHKIVELQAIQEFLDKYLDMQQPCLHESVIKQIDQIEILRKEVNTIIDSIIQKIKQHFGRFSYQAQKYAQELLIEQSPERIEKLSKQIVEIASLKQDEIKIKIIRPLEPLGVDTILKEFIQKLSSYVVGKNDNSSIRLEDQVSIFKNQIKTIETDGEVWCVQQMKNSLLASSGDDNKITIWNVNTLQKIWTSKKHRAIITSLATSIDSKVLVAGSAQGFIKFWDMETKKTINKLQGHTNHVSSLNFSNDNQKLLSSGWDCDINLWILGEKEIQMKKFKKEHEAKIYRVLYSKDCQIIASCSLDKTIRLWDIDGLCQIGQPLLGHSERVDWIEFTSQYLVSCSSLEKNIIIWDYNKRVQVWNFNPGNEAHRICISPDEKMLICIRKEIKAFDLNSRQQVGDSFQAHPYFALCFEYSSDGKYLVAGFQDKKLCIYGIPKMTLL